MSLHNQVALGAGAIAPFAVPLVALFARAIERERERLRSISQRSLNL